jgi:ABC-2 type transport system permease protein
MRNVVVIAAFSLLRLVRDRKALLLLLLMPLILIGILGSALKGAISGSRLEPFDVIVIQADRPAAVPGGTVHFGAIFVDELLGSAQVSRLIRARHESDFNFALAEVAAGKAVAAIRLPPDLTADTLAGRVAPIEVVTDPASPTRSAIVLSIVRSFADSLLSVALALRHLPFDNLPEFRVGPAPLLQESTTGVRAVSAMQYYAAAMAVMFMLMAALARASGVIHERTSGVLDRMLISPAPRPVIIAGQMLGTAVVLLAQFAVLLAGTTWIYGVDWGPLLPVIAVGAGFALAASGLSTAVASLVKEPKTADALVGTVGTLFAALSGAMFPLYGFPPAMKALAKAIPNYWALQAFLDQMAGLGAASLLLPLAVLAAVGAGAGALGAWRLAAR